MINNVIELIGALGLGGLLGSIIQQSLSNRHDAKVKKYQAKKDAYISAISTVSGLGHASAHRLLSNLINDKDINEVDLVRYRSDLSRGMAAAILMGNKELRVKIKEADELVLELKEIIQKMLKKNVPELETELLEKKRQLSRWEDDIIIMMQQDLDS